MLDNVSKRIIPQCLRHNHSCRQLSKRSLNVPVRARHTSFDSLPHIFNVQYVCTCVWVYEVQAAVNSEMTIALVFQAVVSFPLVPDNMSGVSGVYDGQKGSKSESLSLRLPKQGSRLQFENRLLFRILELKFQKQVKSNKWQVIQRGGLLFSLLFGFLFCLV